MQREPHDKQRITLFDASGRYQPALTLPRPRWLGRRSNNDIASPRTVRRALARARKGGVR